MPAAVSCFALFLASCLPAPPKLPDSDFNLMLEDIRLKFWPFALSDQGYRAFTLPGVPALSPRETIPAECASNRLTVAAGRMNHIR